MKKLVDSGGSHDNGNSGHASIDWYDVELLPVGYSQESEADRPFDRNRSETPHSLHDEPPLQAHQSEILWNCQKCCTHEHCAFSLRGREFVVFHAST